MNHKKEFLKTFEKLVGRYDRQRIFRDFVHLSSLEISQGIHRSLDVPIDPQDEKCYLEITSRYEPDEVRGPIAEMFSRMVAGFEYEGGDWLGTVFGELEIGNTALGQFFTPYEVSLLMAEICLDHDSMQSIIEQKGFITFNEPACGSGGMILAFAEKFRGFGFNPQTELFVIAQDISEIAAYMCFIQLSFYGIPAVVLQQNSLWPDQFFWMRYTPVYYWMNWPYRLERSKQTMADNMHAASSTGSDEHTLSVPSKKSGHTDNQRTGPLSIQRSLF